MIKKYKHTPKKEKVLSFQKEYLKTGIDGLDKMFSLGIPKGSSIVIAGGTGSGKTLLCLNIVANAIKAGKKCLYISVEEGEEALRRHMEDFDWKPREYEKEGMFMVKRLDLFDISRSIEGMLEKAKGEIRIEIDPVILPKGFKPEIVVVDSLTGISAAFTGKEQNYRAYIEQLFRFLERTRATSFLITETEQIPQKYSPSGVEEFLADGVIALYHYKKGFLRKSAIEIIKMRGTKHEKKTVETEIVSGSGIEVYPSRTVLEKFLIPR